MSDHDQRRGLRAFRADPAMSGLTMEEINDLLRAGESALVARGEPRTFFRVEHTRARRGTWEWWGFLSGPEARVIEAVEQELPKLAMGPWVRVGQGDPPAEPHVPAWARPWDYSYPAWLNGGGESLVRIAQVAVDLLFVVSRPDPLLEPLRPLVAGENPLLPEDPLHMLAWPGARQRSGIGRSAWCGPDGGHHASHCLHRIDNVDACCRLGCGVVTLEERGEADRHELSEEQTSRVRSNVQFALGGLPRAVREPEARQRCEREDCLNSVPLLGPLYCSTSCAQADA